MLGKRRDAPAVMQYVARRLMLLLFLANLPSCSTPQAALDPPAAGPQDHVLVFGFLRVDNLLLDPEIQRIRMVQTGSTGNETGMDLPLHGNMFFTEPLPVGTRWRIASLSVGEEELPVSLDFTADQAGLLFLGSIELHGEGAGRPEIRMRNTPTERQLLQDLLDAWRETAWEKSIRERMSAIRD
jgi:hypothetical protein